MRNLASRSYVMPLGAQNFASDWSRLYPINIDGWIYFCKDSNGKLERRIISSGPRAAYLHYTIGFRLGVSWVRILKGVISHVVDLVMLCALFTLLFGLTFSSGENMVVFRKEKILLMLNLRAAMS